MSEVQDTGQPRDGDRDTEESDFDPDFKLEPLPRAADILAELPDYPDSEEEEEVRNIMQMISVKGDSNDTDTLAQVPDHDISFSFYSLQFCSQLYDSLGYSQILLLI